MWSVLRSQLYVIPMKLSKWCDITGTSKLEIANKLGTVSSRSVFRWAKSERFPKPQELLRIEQLTEGAVTANDFVKQWAELNGQKEI